MTSPRKPAKSHAPKRVASRIAKAPARGKIRRAVAGKAAPRIVKAPAKRTSAKRPVGGPKRSIAKPAIVKPSIGKSSITKRASAKPSAVKRAIVVAPVEPKLSPQAAVRASFGTYYEAGKEAELTSIGRAKYIAIEGHGAMRAAPWTEAVHALYALANGVKAIGATKGFNFGVAPLETQWWVPGKHDLQDTQDVAAARWHWKMLVRVPDYVPEEWLIAAREKAIESAKAIAGAERARIIELDQGAVVQALYAGPPKEERAALDRMRITLEARHLRPTGLKHEVYLSDPLKSKHPKTILRQPVQQ